MILIGVIGEGLAAVGAIGLLFNDGMRDVIAATVMLVCGIVLLIVGSYLSRDGDRDK